MKYSLEFEVPTTIKYCSSCPLSVILGYEKGNFYDGSYVILKTTLWCPSLGRVITSKTDYQSPPPADCLLKLGEGEE